MAAKFEDYKDLIAISHADPAKRFEAEQIMERVIDRQRNKEKNISDRVRDWVKTTDGEWFRTTDTYDALQLKPGPPREAAYQALLRLRESGEIEKDFRIAGRYRRVLINAVTMDWENAPTDEYKVDWPLGLGDLVEMYPGEIVLVAGEKNSAKTAFLMDLAYRNQAHHQVYYNHRELNESQLRKRIESSLVNDKQDLERWKAIKFLSGSFDFAPSLKVDDFNICDYVHRTIDFAHMGDDIENIYQKMYGSKGRGLVVVATQKYKGREWGLGGQTTLARPNLYITLSEGDRSQQIPHKIKIKIAKSPRDGRSAKDMCREFYVYGEGTMLADTSGWNYEREQYESNGRCYFSS